MNQRDETISKQEEILNSLKKFLAFRERTEREVRTHLVRKGYSESDIELVIEELKENDVINDRRFAQLYISDSIKLARKGPIRIRRELESLGISREETEILLEQEDIQQGLERVLREEISKHVSKTDLTRDSRKRLVNRLLRKGFEYGRISAELNRLT